MIAYISGKIIEVSDKSVTVLAGSIGYRVLAPMMLLTQMKIGVEVALYTSLVVREDDQTLYGFKTPEERRFFEKITNISGIGPGTTLRLLGVYELNELLDAIRTNNVAKLQAVPGIGQKTASRIIVELAQSIDGLLSPTSAALGQVRDALQQMGYTQKESLEMTRELPAEGEVGELLRRALQRKNK